MKDSPSAVHSASTLGAAADDHAGSAIPSAISAAATIAGRDAILIGGESRLDLERRFAVNPTDAAAISAAPTGARARAKGAAADDASNAHPAKPAYSHLAGLQTAAATSVSAIANHAAASEIGRRI